MYMFCSIYDTQEATEDNLSRSESTLQNISAVVL